MDFTPIIYQSEQEMINRVLMLADKAQTYQGLFEVVTEIGEIRLPEAAISELSLENTFTRCTLDCNKKFLVEAIAEKIIPEELEYRIDETVGGDIRISVTGYRPPNNGL
jgi:hypothetical protein